MGAASSVFSSVLLKWFAFGLPNSWCLVWVFLIFVLLQISLSVLGNVAFWLPTFIPQWRHFEICFSQCAHLFVQLQPAENGQVPFKLKSKTPGETAITSRPWLTSSFNWGREKHSDNAWLPTDSHVLYLALLNEERHVLTFEQVTGSPKSQEMYKTDRNSLWFTSRIISHQINPFASTKVGKEPRFEPPIKTCIIQYTHSLGISLSSCAYPIKLRPNRNGPSFYALLHRQPSWKVHHCNQFNLPSKVRIEERPTAPRVFQAHTCQSANQH
jgi:hypothetical protein